MSFYCSSVDWPLIASTSDCWVSYFEATQQSRTDQLSFSASSHIPWSCYLQHFPFPHEISSLGRVSAAHSANFIRRLIFFLDFTGACWVKRGPSLHVLSALGEVCPSCAVAVSLVSPKSSALCDPNTPGNLCSDNSRLSQWQPRSRSRLQTELGRRKAGCGSLTCTSRAVMGH